jgi:very-short-patch-repair endonuclease
LRAKKLSGWKWRRQQPLERYIADFVCFETRLIVEADGGQHAESQADLARDQWLVKQGFRIIRFWNHDILTNPEGVADRILAAQVGTIAAGDALAAPPPLPNPSPARGEGLLQEHHRG